ncbi:hypothetical protein IAU59_001464 [Kwoniella sp. CBS 9459]
MLSTPVTFPNSDSEGWSNVVGPEVNNSTKPILGNDSVADQDLTTSASGYQMSRTPGYWPEQLPESKKSAHDLGHLRSSNVDDMREDDAVLEERALRRGYSLRRPDDPSMGFMLRNFYGSDTSGLETAPSVTSTTPEASDYDSRDTASLTPSAYSNGRRASSTISTKSLRDQSRSAMSYVQRVLSKATSGLSSAYSSRVAI